MPAVSTLVASALLLAVAVTAQVTSTPVPTRVPDTVTFESANFVANATSCAQPDDTWPWISNQFPASSQSFSVLADGASFLYTGGSVMQLNSTMGSNFFPLAHAFPAASCPVVVVVEQDDCYQMAIRNVKFEYLDAATKAARAETAYLSAPLTARATARTKAINEAHRRV